MNTETGRLTKDSAEIVEFLRKHNDKYAGQPQFPRPTLEVGETVLLKDLPLTVEKIKANGALHLLFGDYRMRYDRDDRLEIKGVEFRVTYCAGPKLGLKMVKKP